DASVRPAYVANARNGRAGVRFDGLNDELTSSNYFGLSTDDYEIIVAAHPLSTPPGLVGTSTNSTTWGVLLDQHAAEDYRLTHRNPAGSAGGETVIVNRTDLLRAGWVVATYQSSVANDSMAI